MFGMKLEQYMYNMVACFGSAGDFSTTISMINTLPSHDSPTVWPMLLFACRKWGNMKIAKWAFEHVQQDNCHATWLKS
jgi:hypothetical protein